jgi:hypothetical protein
MPVIITAEVVVVIAEWRLLLWVLGGSSRRMLVVSLALNGASAAAGLIFWLAQSGQGACSDPAPRPGAVAKSAAGSDRSARRARASSGNAAACARPPTSQAAGIETACDR